MATNPGCCEACAKGFLPDSDAVVNEMLEAVRKAARSERLTRVGHWRNMRIHLDGEQADMLVEFAACALYMRGELYGHETPDGTYLRLSASD